MSSMAEPAGVLRRRRSRDSTLCLLDTPPARVFQSAHILIWVDAHANLPPRARWIARADVAP